MTPRASPAPSLPLSIRAYARHRRALGLPGGDESTVRRAVRDGRVPRELVTADGKILDAEAADLAWAANTRSWMAPRTGPTAAKAAPLPVPEIGISDLAVTVSFPLAPFLAGAKRALRAAGKSVTPEALGAAVEAVDGVVWWKLAIDDLNGRLDPDVPLDELHAPWEWAGCQEEGL